MTGVKFWRISTAKIMKISFIQIETRTLRVEIKRQTDVVCEFSSTQKRGFASAWKKLKRIYLWLVSIFCVVAFVTDDGYLISNYHVVKDAAKVRLLTGAGLIDAKVVQVDAANDLALLKADGKFSPLPISSSRSAQLGGTVATVGFPDIGLQGFAPKLAKGEIASLSGAGDDPRYFQISAPVQPGNSGGALVDERGNVIGIVSAKLDAGAALAASGALPENVNYAVKSSLLLSFLESVPACCQAQSAEHGG